MCEFLANAQGGYTPLIRAVDKGYTDCALLLLDAGAHKEAKSNVRGRSAASATFVWNTVVFADTQSRDSDSQFIPGIHQPSALSMPLTRIQNLTEICHHSMMKYVNILFALFCTRD